MNKESRILQDREALGYADTVYANSDPVLFYRPKDTWGNFSNFSRHNVTLPHPFTGQRFVYLTAEHRYQAMKATNAEDHDYVAGASTPSIAKTWGGQIQLRDGWGDSYYDYCYFVMLETVVAKMRQNDGARNSLIRARRRLIYEDSPVDAIWGWRFHENYTGKNLLGRVLMNVARNYL